MYATCMSKERLVVCLYDSFFMVTLTCLGMHRFNFFLFAVFCFFYFIDLLISIIILITEVFQLSAFGTVMHFIRFVGFNDGA